MSQCQQGGDGRTLLDVVSLFAENHGPTTSNSKPPEPEDFGIAKNDQNEPDEGDERIPVRQGLIDFGIFLRHVLYVVKKEKGKDGSSFLGSLLDAFDKCENWDNALCKTFLGKMQSYRKFLDGFVIHLKDEGDANGYYFYHKDKKNHIVILRDCSVRMGECKRLIIARIVYSNFNHFFMLHLENSRSGC